jgi:hypothetical protein
MTPEDETPASVGPAPDDEQAVALILKAYALARDSGKSDWRRMQAGVLKNRLLLLTGGAFDEGVWGVGSFTRFLDLFPHVVRVDRKFAPPLVDLLDEAPDPVPEVALGTVPHAQTGRHEPPWRLRRDLWSAVMDLHADGVYVWDSGEATLVESGTPSEPAEVLPTLTPDELASWQREFAEQQTAQDSKFATVLAQWTELETPTESLPRHLRNAWFAQLKRRVRDRLEEWFGANGISAPDDMIQLIEPRTGARSREEPHSADDLRALVIRCVESMTRAELEELRLPPSAVLRAHL